MPYDIKSLVKSSIKEYNNNQKEFFEKLEEQDVSRLKQSTISNLHKFAIDYADAVVQASPDINKGVYSHIKSSGKPFMEYPGVENYIDAYQNFYEQFIHEEEALEELEEEPEEALLTHN